MESRLVRIPRHLLHVQFDDLERLGVSGEQRDRLRALLADLPLLPDASHSAQLTGESDLGLACLAVLARHVGQGLRDHNLSLAHDREQLRLERRKMVFLDEPSLADLWRKGDQRLAREAVLFVFDATAAILPLLHLREAYNLASFVGVHTGLQALSHWRTL